MTDNATDVPRELAGGSEPDYVPPMGTDVGSVVDLTQTKSQGGADGFNGTSTTS